MAEVKDLRPGTEWVVDERHGGHLRGKRVLVLQKPHDLGFFEFTYRVDVRCQCCKETFERVEVQYLN